MKATLYMQGKKKPVAILDEVNIIQMNDNHKASPLRITYKTQQFNSGKTKLELNRDEKLTLKLEDGRDASVLLQHASLDMHGFSVGVLRVLDGLAV